MDKRDELRIDMAYKILASLRRKPEELSRSEIHTIFSRHRTAGQIERALSHLRRKGTAQPREVQTKGRRAQIWIRLALSGDVENY